MSVFETLESELNILLNQDSPPVVELRKALLEIEEFIASPDYQNLPAEQREHLLDLRKGMKARLRSQQDQEGASDSLLVPQASLNATSHLVDQSLSPGDEIKQRDPQAEQFMEEAESLFYGGRYAEAIKLFDRVLHIEPNWERPRQHRTESENYLRTGYIPPVALPAEAASAFGKAQSAARVGRYSDALTLLNNAQSVLRGLGIQRWQEGLEFEQKLQESIDAENAYQEGLNLFKQGEIDEAIDRVETATRATGLPKYAERAQQLRNVRETIRGIHDTLSALSIEPRMVAQAKSELDKLSAEYGENPTLQRLRARLEGTLPRAVAPLKDQSRSLKAQAERAVTLEETIYLARQSRSQLEQIRNLEGMDESLDRLQTEIERLIHETERFEGELSQATIAYENNKRWPARAAHLSQEVRQRYPSDPGVIRLNRSLRPFYTAINLLKLALATLIVLAIGALGWWGTNHFRAYLTSLTPTPTATPTTTATATTTPTATFTPTITSTSTPTFTATSTPTVGIAMRDIWARSGCYEGFSAIGRISAGGALNFLPAERRFDQFNRECILIEYQEDGKSVIGWVLFADVGSPGESSMITPTP